MKKTIEKPHFKITIESNDAYEALMVVDEISDMGETYSCLCEILKELRAKRKYGDEKKKITWEEAEQFVLDIVNTYSFKQEL
jgi:hypoxanthine phosphoribosyltransferase